MPESTSPAPLPPSGGEPNPNSTPEESKRRAPGALNQEQVQAVNRDKSIALTAQDPLLVARLTVENITPAFVATLLTDIEAALNRGSKAVMLTDKKEGATEDVQDAADDLINALRTAQAKARQAYFHSDPTKLKDYFIGERIDANRGTLDQSAQGVVARLTEDHPAGANTDFINMVEGKRQAFIVETNKQSTDGGQAKSERELRDDAVVSIRQRTQQIQFAADAAWPPHVPGHGGIRRRFHLPADRPFTG